MVYETGRSIRRKKSICTFQVFLFILTIGGIFALLFFFLYKPSTAVVSPIPKEGILSFILPIFSPKKNPEELKKSIVDAIGTTLPRYSVVVKDFQSDFTVTLNAESVFTGASVNKLPILGVLYYLVQKGEINPDKEITLQEDDIQDYGTGSIRYDPLGTRYSIRTLAKLMTQQSDNTAAFLLGRHVVGMEKIQKLIDSWGMAQTDMENNKTSNADMALLLEKIYREKVANHDLTSEMLSFLKDGTIEDRIPAQLPKDTLIYHKTGNGVGLLHDVGIVVGPKTTYYIGMFTSDVPNEEDTIRLLAVLSRIIYDFMK